MAIQVQGQEGNVAGVQGTTFRALKTTNVPTDYGALGHYKISGTTGVMAAGLAAASPIFYARWTDASKLAVITKLSIDGMFASTAFAVGQILFRAFIARGFTAENGTPGGVALTTTGNNQKMRTSMGTTLMNVVRISTTATLAAPTWTLDSNPVGQINTHSSAGVGAAAPIIGSIYLPVTDVLTPDPGAGEHPLVLAQNEGIAVQATVPGTGVWTAGITLRWAEVTAY